jgi:tripartite-type tricarboxylate transporter receptor subunit TctC
MKTINRLTAAFLALGASALCSAQPAALSPNKPFRFILPVAAGGSADVAARVIARELSTVWKQPVIVDNRPGGGTTVATNAIALAPPDGHTFGWVIAAHAINPSLYPSLPYDTLRDFAGVTLVYQLRTAIVAAPSLPANTVKELIALAKARPGELSYASPATGSGPHLLGELFKLKYGVDMLHIGYKGGSSAHPDVMSGRVPLMFDPLPGALPHIRSGKLKVIAIIADGPVPGFPEFPVLTALLPRDATSGWNGIVVPARTRRAIVAKLNADIIAAVRSVAIQERLAALTVESVTSTPEKFDLFIREEVARWAEVVKRAGIKLEQGS